MSTILKNYTPEQFTKFMQDYIIAEDVGLTNFNEGSDVRALIEAVGIVASILGHDFLESLRKSIPILLYTGLKFDRKSASVSTGFLRFFRLPVFYITYSGVDSDVQLDITALQLTLTTSGTPADDVTVDFATFTTIDAVVAEIESKTNWSATKVLDGSVGNLWMYSGRQIVNNVNYKQVNNTVDVMSSGATAIVIPTSAQASIGAIIIETTIAGAIAAGDATSLGVAAVSLQTGPDSNIEINAINTLNGSGVLNTAIPGVEYVINDSVFLNGANQETEEERALRFQTFVSGLHGGTVFGIEQRILEIEEIKSVTLKERDPAPGFNTIVADDGTGNLSLDAIAEIRRVMDGDPDDLTNYPGAGVAGITYNIEAPTIIAVDVTAVIFRIGSISDATELKNAVQAAVETYINTRRLGDNVVYTELIKRMQSAHPAVYSISLTTPITDIAIDLDEIPRTGSGTGGTVSLSITTLTSVP